MVLCPPKPIMKTLHRDWPPQQTERGQRRSRKHGMRICKPICQTRDPANPRNAPSRCGLVWRHFPSITTFKTVVSLWFPFKNPPERGATKTKTHTRSPGLANVSLLGQLSRARVTFDRLETVFRKLLHRDPFTGIKLGIPDHKGEGCGEVKEVGEVDVHSTPDHCLVNAGFQLYPGVEKATCFNWSQSGDLSRSPASA